jgi:hypothetical protein
MIITGCPIYGTYNKKKYFKKEEAVLRRVNLAGAWCGVGYVFLLLGGVKQEVTFLKKSNQKTFSPCRRGILQHPV